MSQPAEDSDAWYTPTKLEDRPSQHVGFSNFIDWFGKLALTGLAVGSATWVAAKIFKPKIPIPESVKEVGEPFGLWQDTHIAPSSYFGLGTKVGVLVKAFMMWRKGEAEHLGVLDMNKDLSVINNAIPDAKDVVEDSQLVSKMIDYEKRQQAALVSQPQAHILAQASQHHGAVAHAAVMMNTTL